jgi:hypothetical protein
MRLFLGLVLALIVGIAIGAVGESYFRLAPSGRTPVSAPWQIVAQPGAGFHAWRLHTITGEVDFCSIEDAAQKCVPVEARTTDSNRNTTK